MDFLRRLEEIVTVIDTEIKTCPSNYKKHRQFALHISEKIDYVAYMFLLGPFIFNQTAAYSYYINLICDITCSIGSHQEYYQKSATEELSVENSDFLLGVCCLLDKLCIDIHEYPEVMIIQK
jgi:hypothetical protein